jgi:hypothetical protein
MLGLDYIGTLPETPTGNKYILNAVDYFTRWEPDENSRIRKLEVWPWTISIAISVGPYSQAETFNLQKSGSGRTPCIPRIYRRTHHVFGTWEVYTEFQLFNLHVQLTCRIFHT